MTFTSNTHPKYRVALFGPQQAEWTIRQLADLQLALSQDIRLSNLRESLKTLPSLWPLLESIYGSSHGFPGARKLQNLSELAIGSATLDSTSFSNTELAPLTVISQIAHWIQVQGDALGQCEAAQGFCIGFLSAVAISLSHNRANFDRYVSNAVRLATCLGIIVDMENMAHVNGGDSAITLSVRCKSQRDRVYLDMCLDNIPRAYVSCIKDENELTVTLPQSSQETLFSDLSKAGIAAVTVGIYGSYHHEKHRKVAEQLSKLCASRADLQFPDAKQLRLPLRSTASTECIVSGALHDISIQLILCEHVQWIQTIKNTIGDHSLGQVQLLSFGNTACIPRSLANKSLREQLPHASEDNVGTEEIAIIGMACRFPQSNDLEEFWRLLRDGKTAIGSLPLERFDPASLTREPRLTTFWANFMENPAAFDHNFFGISGREAKSMDPQQRLALQVAYEAMESAGYCGKQKFTDVGCYLGVGSVDYEANVASRDANAFAATGTLRAFISGRISHFFGWEGPSLTIDTACSSSAVAIHTARKALLGGECSIAVAGGVNVITSPAMHQNLAAASFLNTKGQSRAFDNDASGYCRGEGCGIIVLKPLSKALADRDRVLGVLASSAVNQNSNCSSITVPDCRSQQSLYKRVLDEASIQPQDVTYVEAHGTGTQVGDPIEFESIRAAFMKQSRPQGLYVGSVKDNIGHAEAASGSAGIIKVLLMMQHRMIPKQANFKTLNRKIQICEGISVPTSTIPWAAPKKVALVNNYGAAGSNAALLIRDHRAVCTEYVESRSTTYPFLFSAKSEISLNAFKEKLKQYLFKEDITLGSLAFNLAISSNSAFERRMGFCANDCRSALLSIDGPNSNSIAKPPVVLCIGGQNGISVSISRKLYDDCDLFKAHLDHCDSVCQATLGFSIFPDIFEETAKEDTVSLHCMLLSLQIACGRSWIDSGLDADTIIGHSFGQLTALCLSGSIGLEDTFRLVAGRARLVRDEWGPERGSMMAVECDPIDINKIIEKVNSQSKLLVEVACYNGPRSFVLAGDVASISHAKLECKGFKTMILQNDHAYHSHLTNNILQSLHQLAETIQFQPPRIRVETCTSGTSWSEINPKNIVEHTRQPVYFNDAINRIISRLPSAVWLEVGSDSPMISMVQRIVNKPSRSDVFISMQLGNRTDAEANLANATCTLWNAGQAIRHWLFHRSSSHRYRKLNLPPYQFEKSSHWLPFESALPLIGMGSNTITSIVELVKTAGAKSGEHVFLVNTQGAFFQLAARGHAVTGQSLCPASMYVEMVAQSADTISKRSGLRRQLPHLKRLSISAPLGLGDSSVTVIHLCKTTNRDTWEFTINSQHSVESCKDAILHASGTFHWEDSNDPDIENRSRLLSRLGKSQTKASSNTSGISGTMVYDCFGEVVEYADYYRGVYDVSAYGCNAIGLVKVPPQRPASLHAGICDPIILDNFLQVSGIHCNSLSNRDKSVVLMCTSIDEIIFSPGFLSTDGDSREWMVYTRYEEKNSKTRTNDIFVYDSRSGDMVVTILGANFHAVAFKSLTRTLARVNRTTGITTKNVAEITSPPDSSSEIGEINDSGYSSEPQYEENKLKQSDTNITVSLASRLDQFSSEATRISDVLIKVRTMFSQIMEMPVEKITPTTTLNALGIDSLLVTEVITDLSSLFGISISLEQFSECSDVLAVANLVGSVNSTIGKTNLEDEDASKSAQTNNLPRDGLNIGRLQFESPTGVAKSGQEAEKRTNLASTAQKAFNQCSTSFDEHANTTKFKGFYENVFPIQSELVVVYVLEAFAKLGCDLRQLAPNDILPKFQYQSRHTKLVTQLHHILVDAQLVIVTSDGQYARSEKSPPPCSPTELTKSIIRRFPQHTSEVKLLHTTAHKLAECLTGAENPISLIFQNAEARTLLGDVYANAPMFKTGTLQLTEYLNSILIQSKNSRKLKILELGAGTGGTTKTVVETLAKHGASFTYTFTDLSPSLVAQAKRKFSHWSFMEFMVMDIEKQPELEFLSTYDIVLSTNCIHATKDLVVTTTNIRKMLKHDGILCLVELTRNLYWFDLVFGLLEGWWLFTDGRKHALATEQRWKQDLGTAGFRWVDWSQSLTKESELLRVIIASPKEPSVVDNSKELTLCETFLFKEVDGLQLYADVYYPDQRNRAGQKLPVALMIHGGGHIMLSRKDIRRDQTHMLLRSGFLAVSIDYRLCPEVTLTEGPMTDVADALQWINSVLPSLSVTRGDISVDTSKIVAVGWSTGGHLATTLSWTAITRGIDPPKAILAFYCPLDYEDDFWTLPNVPEGASESQEDAYDLDSHIWDEGVFDKPITTYRISPSKQALGGWMADTDPRSRLALHMNCQGRTLHILLNGLDKRTQQAPGAPTKTQIMSVSPLAQIRAGNYATPTFIIHPRNDDLIPWKQAERTWQALRDLDIDAELRILEGVSHLFDVKGFNNIGTNAKQAILDGYNFLCKHVGLTLCS